MSGINKVIIVGRLGQDPEVRFMPNGNAAANFTVATSEKWKDKQTGEQKEKTEWHKITMFGRLAEIAGEYLKKGSNAYFEGKLQTRKWQNQQGQDQYTTEIVVSEMQMLDSRSQDQQPSRQQGQSNSQGFRSTGQQYGQQQGYQNQQNPTYQQAAQAPRDNQGFTAKQGGFQQQAPQQGVDVGFDDISF